MTQLITLEPMTETEQEIILEHFKDPVLIKYIKTLSNGLLLDLAEAVPAMGQSDTEFVREQQSWRGALSAYKSLLSLHKES